jgi:hypothetical protein
LFSSFAHPYGKYRDLRNVNNYFFGFFRKTPNYFLGFFHFLYVCRKDGIVFTRKFLKDLFPFGLPKRIFPYFCHAIPGENGTARESAFFALFLIGESAQFA